MTVFERDWSGSSANISIRWAPSLGDGFDGQVTWASEKPIEGLGWTKVQASSAFSHRDTAETFSFGDFYWLSNGYQYGGNTLRDLWKSQDGLTWSKVLDQTPYPSYAQVLPYQNQIFAISNEIWTSTDGEIWTKISEETPFPHTAEQNALIFKDQIWMLTQGGAWSSSDGTNWTQASSFPFGTRHHFSSAVFNDQIIVAGGFSDTPNTPPEVGYTDKTSFNDVWASQDGMTWTQLAVHADWSPRFFAPLQVYNNNLYMLGGYDNLNGANFSEVWLSADGTDWSLLSGATFSARHFSSSLLVDGKLELLAGNGWPTLNDIWTFDDLGLLPNEHFQAASGLDIRLGSGNDLIVSGGGALNIYGGGGADIITLANGDRFVFGGPGDDIIHAAPKTSYSSQWGVGDFDGDGKDDVFRYVPSLTGADVWLSDGASFHRTGGWQPSLTQSQSTHIGDFNGDGRDDIFAVGLPDQDDVMWLSNGASFTQTPAWTSSKSGQQPWHVGDFNGDGMSDLLRYNVSATTSEVLLSNGISFDAAGEWLTLNQGKEPWYVGDFNGDGMTDVFRYLPGVTGANVWLSDGAKFVDAGNWTAAGHGPERWYIADANGDQKADIFRYLPGVSGANVWLSDGTQFVDVGNWTGAGCGISNWLIGDFNGDLSADLLRTLELGGVTSVFTSTGSAFSENGLWGGGDSSVFGFTPDSGRDQILGFKAGGIDHDQLSFEGFGLESVTDVLPLMSQTGDSVFISLSPNTSVELFGLSISDLSSDSSIFLFG